MSWIEPVFDRTQQDVIFASQNQHLPQPLKGARTYQDMLRITNNMKYLGEKIEEYGYKPPPLVSKLNWSLGEVATHSDISKIRLDLNLLKSSFFVLPETPATPSLPYLAYQKMNDIEKILFDIRYILDMMEAATIYSGQMYSGEPFDIARITFQKLVDSWYEAELQLTWPDMEELTWDEISE